MAVRVLSGHEILQVRVCSAWACTLEAAHDTGLCDEHTRELTRPKRDPLMLRRLAEREWDYEFAKARRRGWKP